MPIHISLSDKDLKSKLKKTQKYIQLSFLHESLCCTSFWSSLQTVLSKQKKMRSQKTKQILFQDSLLKSLQDFLKPLHPQAMEPSMILTSRCNRFLKHILTPLKEFWDQKGRSIGLLHSFKLIQQEKSPISKSQHLIQQFRKKQNESSRNSLYLLQEK